MNTTLLIFTIVGFAFGVCFSSVCMAAAWLSDVRGEHKRLKDAREEAYNDGVAQGKRWRLKEVILAEREMDEIRAEIQEIKDRV